MNFESESEYSLNGNDRKGIEKIIHSTMDMIQSLKSSSAQISPPSEKFQLFQTNLPDDFQISNSLSLQEILDRYYEINEQLNHHYHNSHPIPASLPKKTVIQYLSWPEHFHRQQNNLISQPPTYPNTPWDGSQYMITLLTSLANKLLLKYTFQFLQIKTKQIKKSQSNANQKYQRKCHELVKKIFIAWKESWYEILLTRLSLAKGCRHHTTILLKRGYRNWRNSTFYQTKYQKLYSLVTERYCNHLLLDALQTFKQLLTRRQRRNKFIKRAKKRLGNSYSKNNFSSSSSSSSFTTATTATPNANATPSASAHSYYSLMLEGPITAIRLRQAILRWARVLEKKKKRNDLVKRGQRIVDRTQKRVLVRCLCQWLKSMAVAKKQKQHLLRLSKIDRGTQPDLEFNFHSKQSVDKATSPPLSINKEQLESIDNTSGSSHSSNHSHGLSEEVPPPAASQDNSSVVGVEEENEDYEDEGGEDDVLILSPLPSPPAPPPPPHPRFPSSRRSHSHHHNQNVPLLISLTEKPLKTKVSSTSLKQLDENTLLDQHSDTIPPIEFTDSNPPSQSTISNITEESQIFKRKTSANLTTPDSSELTMPHFEANQSTLPLSYAIYQLEKTGRTKSSSLEQISQTFPVSQSNSNTTDNNSSNSNSNIKIKSLSKQYPQRDELDRDLQVHLIESRHRIGRLLDTHVNLVNKTTQSSKTKNSKRIEIERRFLRCQWIRLGELFQVWKYKSRGQRVLRNVFQLSASRWEDRYERSKSDFMLLWTVFTNWIEFIQHIQEKRERKQLNQRALVFRGMNLLAKGFTGWIFGLQELRRERHETRIKELIVMANCWIEWLKLIKESRLKMNMAVVNSQKKLLSYSWLRWQEYLKYTSFEQQTVSSVVQYIQLKRYLHSWRVGWRYQRVLRLHGRYLFKREENELRRLFSNWLRCHHYRCAVRSGSQVIQSIVFKFRIKRLFKNWPGRELSVAASLMRQNCLRRKEHYQRESTINQKIIKGLEFNEGNEGNEVISLVPVGETPLSAGLEHERKLSFDSSSPDVLGIRNMRHEKLPSTGRTVTGTVINSISSFPHFQWIHLPPTHHSQIKHSNTSSLANIKSKNPSRQPFVIRGSQIIPKDPPHHLGYQNRAVAFGFSDGLAPTRQVITKFLQLILSLWRDFATRRGEISRRGLFLRACCRLRILSKLFYDWISRTSSIAYRNRIWTGRNRSISLFSSEIMDSTGGEEKMA